MLTTADQLRAWRSDVVDWARENVHLRDPMTGQVGPIALQPHQEAFLRDATATDRQGAFNRRVCVASWPRREGKSLCVSLLLAWRMATWTQQDLAVIANSERQAASVLFDGVCDVFRLSPALRGLVPEECYQTRKLQVPALGNTLETYPANWRTVQGVRFDVLACDELHASEDGGKAFAFASQSTESMNAQVLVSSQAGAPVESNPLWRLYNSAEGHVLFSYRTMPSTPWSIARAERARGELLPLEFAYQWENSWGATGAKLFPIADIEQACMDYAEPQTRAEWEALCDSWNVRGVGLAAGLDRAGVGRGGDRSVWTVTARLWPLLPEAPRRVSLIPRKPVPVEPELYRVVRCTVFPTGAEHEITAEVDLCRRIFGRVGRTMAEAYQCADLVNRLPNASLEAPSSQRQQGLFGDLRRLFTEGRIGFPALAGRDPRTGTPGLLKQELLAFEYDCDRGGLTRFGTQSGQHDDTTYSLAWSRAAAASLSTPVTHRTKAEMFG